jgi:hypothetical protein
MPSKLVSKVSFHRHSHKMMREVAPQLAATSVGKWIALAFTAMSYDLYRARVDAGGDRLDLFELESLYRFLAKCCEAEAALPKETPR